MTQDREEQLRSLEFAPRTAKVVILQGFLVAGSALVAEIYLAAPSLVGALWVYAALLIIFGAYTLAEGIRAAKLPGILQPPGVQWGRFQLFAALLTILVFVSLLQADHLFPPTRHSLFLYSEPLGKTGWLRAIIAIGVAGFLYSIGGAFLLLLRLLLVGSDLGAQHEQQRVTVLGTIARLAGFRGAQVPVSVTQRWQQLGQKLTDPALRDQGSVPGDGGPAAAAPAWDIYVRSSHEKTLHRLSQELILLTNRANTNLAVGIIIAGLGLAILTTSFWAAATPDPWITTRIIALTAAIEVLAFFFLRIYRSTLLELRVVHNELTGREARLTAFELAQHAHELRTQSFATALIEDLLATERNPALSQGVANASAASADEEHKSAIADALRSVLSMTANERQPK